MDRRLTASNGRVAHMSLHGQVTADTFSEGEPHRIQAVVSDLMAENGSRERQLLRGEVFVVLDRVGEKVFGYSEKDGYVGWLAATDFIGAPKTALTHKVTAVRSYSKTTPGLKTMGKVEHLPFGAAVTVLDETDGWAKIDCSRGLAPKDAFVPAGHLSPIGTREHDPVAVAEKFIGTPYLWGGNSAFGIDCSGLVQTALLACGIPCPGDSDMQEADLGETLVPGSEVKRGDLFFWKGHVAMAVDSARLIHANAYNMAVAYEPIQDAIARIQSQGDGPVTRHARLT
ncbi:MAG: NlpC/P60 family protein [Pelagimonas sp.]|uniref:C40 family peptidase n=1 Tax=Pelagimonas sp. TaxID=2073170 RepID=UPI003D6A7729